MALGPAVAALHGASIRDHRGRIEVGDLEVARDGAADPAALVLLPLDPRARRIADATRAEVAEGPVVPIDAGGPGPAVLLSGLVLVGGGWR